MARRSLMRRSIAADAELDAELVIVTARKRRRSTCCSSLFRGNRALTPQAHPCCSVVKPLSRAARRAIQLHGLGARCGARHADVSRTR